MGAITQGTAEIKLVLNTKDAEAEYRRWLSTMKGGAVAVPGIGPGGGGGTVPGGGGTWHPGGGGGGGGGAPGGGFLSNLLGFALSNPLSSALMAAGGAFAAPIIGDAAGGALKRLTQAGSDVSESLGLGSWNRDASRPGKTADRTVDMLKYAGAGMSSEQIQAIAGMNRAIVDLETDSENKVRETLGTARVSDFFERMAKSLESIDGKTAPQTGGAATSMGGR